jgi:hypothetical protein
MDPGWRAISSALSLETWQPSPEDESRTPTPIPPIGVNGFEHDVSACFSIFYQLTNV